MIIEVNLLPYGIIYFASAHVLYIIAFSAEYAFNAWNLVLAVVLAAFVAFFYLKIRGKTQGLDVPILIYSIVVSLMAFFAVSSLDSGLSGKAVLASLGAAFFIVSDSLLAYFSFIKPNKYESVISWAFYAPAQLMIALSCFY